MKHIAVIVNHEFPEFLAVADDIRRRADAVYATTVAPRRTLPTSRTNFYYYYPFLFRTTFPQIDEEAFRTIALAGVLYLDHVCLLDKMLDEPNEVPPHLPFLSAQLHEKALHLVSSYFPPESRFWSELWNYHDQFAKAMLDERRQHFRRIRAYEPGEYFRLATGKSALSKGTTTALAVLGGATDILDRLSISQDYFNAAFQTYDDIKDWRDDFASGRYSDIITRGIIRGELGVAVETDAPNVTDDLARHIYYSGPVEEAIKAAINWCNQATEAVEPLVLGSWIRLIRLLKSQIESLNQDFGAIRSQTILRSQGYLSNGLGHLIRGAAESMISEQRAGYPEASHSMGFNLSGAKSDVHSACVFQRAVLADVLLDVRDAGIEDTTSIIRQEIDNLAQARLTSVQGGWSYFPTLKELPPDADDLGQILQVFVRSGCAYERTPIDDALRLLFDKNSCGDGSFETWIIDPESADDNTRAMKLAINRFWGRGPDVEVVANLAYGLTFYEQQQYRQRISDAAAWVEKQQRPEGNWIPTWYATTYYGTYAATRLLSQVAPSSPTLARAYAFLAQAQRDDGGYGDEKSTPLETALALLTLSCFNGPEARSLRESAVQYLELTASRDCTWNATPFIRMETDRATRKAGVASRRVLTFKSRTVSSGYVLKALIAAAR